MQKQDPQTPNPNTPAAWDSLWKGIGLAQAKDPWIQDRLTKVAEMIPEGVSVIDLAAGTGIIRHKLSVKSKYVPVDFSQKALDLCQVPGILAPCTDVPVDDNSFHTVLGMEIIEHMDKPYRLLLEAARIANHQVIVTVPDNRLPPQQFNMHRRTWTRPQFHEFLQTFDRFASIHITKTAANLVALCTLPSKDSL